MMLLRLSGHSGAGKSRLAAALPRYGVTCPRAVLYTSRAPRQGEIHARDYYFLSRGAIAALPSSRFLVGPVHETLQAVDLDQVTNDLEVSGLVLVEIYAGLWPDLEHRIAQRLGGGFRSTSVFMTAVDPATALAQCTGEARVDFVRRQVEDILRRRGCNNPEDIIARAASAAREVCEAIGPEGGRLYARVIHSAPEGPDGDDDWTREAEPVGRARHAIDEFLDLVQRDGRP